MNKQTSDRIGTIAARVLAAGNPLDENQELRASIGQAVYDHISSASGAQTAARKPFDPATICDAISPLLAPYFADMRSLAGSALAQDEA